MTDTSPFDDERRNIAELLRDWPPTVVDAVIEEMLELWNAQNLRDQITWRWNSRLRTTIGRAMLEDMVLELNPLLLGRNPQEMRGVVVHELAHLVTTKRYGFSVNPHGAEWKSLMRASGESTRATHTLNVDGLRVKKSRRRRRRKIRILPFMLLALLLPLISCASQPLQSGTIHFRGEVDLGAPGAVLLDDGFGDVWFGDLRSFDLDRVSLRESEAGGFMVLFRINEQQAAEFGDFTAGCVGRKMAIVVDGQLLSAPIVQERLSRSGSISGGAHGFSKTEAEALIAQIQDSE
jgi:predicted SprT family Zn-dependent metalloprotease